MCNISVLLRIADMTTCSRDNVCSLNVGHNYPKFLLFKFKLGRCKPLHLKIGLVCHPETPSHVFDIISCRCVKKPSREKFPIGNSHHALI